MLGREVEQGSWGKKLAVRVGQYYALIIASWAHGNCDWAAEILTHAINRLEVARLQLCTD